jgi:hypothetical protein
MKWYLFFLVIILPVLMGTVPAQQIDNLGGFANELRIDMERLADEVLDGAPRPEGWTANIDIRSETMISDLWFDNELLANTFFGGGLRPPGWLSITTNRAEIVARNVRHDLELTASEIFGARNRPEEWRGASPLFQCSRSLQNAVTLAARFYDINIETLASTLNYCLTTQAELEEKLADQLGLSESPDNPERLLAVRGDLERLADEKLGLDNRPQGYIRNTNTEAPTFIGDLFLDLEALTNELLGQNTRPDGWIGVVSNNAYISWRNLRHDLEALADVSLGLETRLRGWQRESLLHRCAPVTQDLVTLVTQFEFDPVSIAEESNCATIATTANTTAEEAPTAEGEERVEGDNRFLGEAEYAFTYLDVGATQYMGIMPAGVEFRAWYRNFGDSGMMFVSGEEFAVFVDRRWTSLGQDNFDRLPTLEGIAPLTFCDASWCNGPGPTPTPTGSGPLALLLAEATPPSAPDIAEIVDKIQVSWNNIRVTYLTDNPEARTAQVALEICNEPQLIDCEPVLRIFDNSVGAPKAVLSQFNGLNVYDFSYGYTANLLVEGSTRTSADIWISDPSIR